MTLVPVALVNTSGLLESLVDGISSIAEIFIEMMTSSILSILDLRFTFGGTENYLSAYFSFLDELYFICQIIGFSLLFLIVLFNVFKGLTGGFAESENPWILLGRALVCCGAIAVAAQIMTGIYTPGNILLEKTRELFQEAKNAPASEMFKKSVLEKIITLPLTAFMRIAIQLVLILFNILIFVNYIKLALECLERWVVLAALFYTSPIAFSLAASRNTVNVFKAWTRMVLSSIVMLCLNMAFIYIYLTAIRESAEAQIVFHTFQAADVGVFAGPIVYCWVLLAILKTGQKLDQYCASLGLSTAQVGTMLGGEFMSSMMGLARTAMTMGRMHAMGKKQAEAAQATKLHNAAIMKSKGFNPDGSQMVVNSGLKPTAQEMRNALQGKGAAFTGEGNAAAVKDMLNNAKDETGNNPLQGAEIMESSVTSEGCAVINAVNADGTMAQYKLHTEKPDGVETKALEMDDGSTMYLESLPVAVGGIPDIQNSADFNEHFAPKEENTAYNENGDVVEASNSSGGNGPIYNSNNPETRAEFGSSYMSRAVEQYGPITEPPKSDLNGNIVIPHENGSITTLSPAANTSISGSNYSRIVDNHGAEWIARNHAQPIAQQFGATEAQINRGSMIMTPAMRQNFASYLNVPAESLGREVHFGENGYSAMVATKGSSGEVTYHNIANSDTMQARPNHTINNGDPHYGYDNKTSSENESSGFAVKGATSVCTGTDKKEIQRAFVPVSRNTALSAAGVQNFMTEVAENDKFVQSQIKMSGDGGQNPAGNKIYTDAPTIQARPTNAPASYTLNGDRVRISDLTHIAYDTQGQPHFAGDGKNIVGADAKNAEGSRKNPTYGEKFSANKTTRRKSEQAPQSPNASETNKKISKNAPYSEGKNSFHRVVGNKSNDR